MKELLIGFFLITTSVNSFAQKITLIKGSLNLLKELNAVGLIFNYDNMVVGSQETISEAEYVNDRKTKLNKEETGKGEQWEKLWVDDRKNRFEPQFRDLFSKNSKMKLTDNTPYTIIFHTTRTEPGWYFGGIIKKNARIDAKVLIVETLNKSKILAEIEIIDSPGRAPLNSFANYDTGARIQEAYAKAGKELARFIESQNNKK